LDRRDGGVDSEFSLDPGELHLLVRETDTAWRALGTAYVGPTESEAEG
jgi:N-acetylneuraminate synthase